MSFRGEIEAQCPNGCESFAAEVWSYIRGDRDSPLRMAVLARECNMLICPQCSVPFFPEASYVYCEPANEVLAFVFPESYKAREDYWRGKMREDFAAMKGALGADFPLELEPEIFFGPEPLADLLAKEDYRGEEQEVMEHFARELGLSLYRISARYARDSDLPRALPSTTGPGETPTRESVVAGLRKVLAANDRLQDCARALASLSVPGTALPPSAPLPRGARKTA